MMGRKVAEEKRLRDHIASGCSGSGPRCRRGTPTQWARSTGGQGREGAGRIIKEYTSWRTPAGSTAPRSASPAPWLRAADELPKPNGERLREFADARLPSLKFQLFSDEPIYEDLETVKLADGLTFLANTLGPETSWSRRCSPASRRGSGPSN
jgi:hypothetical protein